MANTYLTRTPSSTGNTKIFTFSSWLKISTIKEHMFFTCGVYSSTSLMQFYLNSNGTLTMSQETSGGSIQATLTTTQVFRDTSAWYHIVIAIDTTQGTDSNRVKLYVNGTQVTSFSTATYPSINTDFAFNTSGVINTIGNRSGGSFYFDGSMSHVHLIDGTAYDATAFGEYDANGVWKINTSPSVTYGTNGFFILKNGNSVTDQSGNSNNFTVASGTLTNTEDNPSNVFNVWNVLDVVAGTNAPLENGNTTYKKTATGSTTSGSRMGTIGVSSGKWYWEFKSNNIINYITGIIRVNHAPSAGLQGWLANDAGAYGLYDGGGQKTVAGTVTADGNVAALGLTVAGMAIDLDNGKFYSHVNGVYMNSGDPTSGATGTGSLMDISLTNTYVPWVCNQDYNQANDIDYNFGNGYFGTTAVASAGTNASGIGIFEYDVPTGYTALSTKGLNL
jgi:hypothetical protein